MGGGSGKTVAYALPCLQSILTSKALDSTRKKTSVLIIVPTHDLAGQVSRVFVKLAEFCGKTVRTLNLMSKVSESVLATRLNEVPNVIVATPGKIVSAISYVRCSRESDKRCLVDG